MLTNVRLLELSKCHAVSSATTRDVRPEEQVRGGVRVTAQAHFGVRALTLQATFPPYFHQLLDSVDPSILHDRRSIYYYSFEILKQPSGVTEE